MLTDMGVFTKVGQELKTKKDILISIRAFRMSLMLYGLSVSGPGSTEPSGNLGVVQMSREIQSASRDSRDRYHRW